MTIGTEKMGDTWKAGMMLDDEVLTREEADVLNGFGEIRESTPPPDPTGLAFWRNLYLLIGEWLKESAQVNKRKRRAA